MSSTSFFKKHPTLTILFFNLAVLIFIFILFEIGLRIFTPTWLAYTMNYLKTGKGFGYGTDSNLKIDYRNGEFYSFTPNSTFKIYHNEYENTVNINLLGGRMTQKNEIPDTTNIIPFTGDSFIMGIGVEDTQAVVALTKKTLSYNLLNLGVSGSSMPVQRKILNRRYNELGRPPLVIYGYFIGNDFDDIIKQYEKIKVKDSLLQNNISQNTNAEQNTGFTWRMNNFINHNTILKNIYVLQFIKQKIMNIKNKDKDKQMNNWDPIFKMMYSLNKTYITQAKSYIDQEIETLSKEPYQPLVIIIPDRYQINSSLRNKMGAYYNLDPKYISPYEPTQILIETLKKYKIKYIDATQCVNNNQGKGILYYNLDNHFTKLGQEVFSSCIADTLGNLIKRIIKK